MILKTDPNMRPEEVFLAAGLAHNAAKSYGKGLQDIGAADWPAVIREAEKRGVSALLYTRVRERTTELRVADRDLSTLRDLYLNSASRNVKLFEELKGILLSLQKSGISTILLKGPHLAEIIYGNIAVRPMVDLDILVRKEELMRTAEILRGSGYRESRHFSLDTECAVWHHLPPFVRPGAVGVEIHWGLSRPTEPFKIDIDGLWKRARPARIAGVDTSTLSTEDLIISLCLHASYQHRFRNGLRSLCDIQETLTYYSDNINWKELLERSSQWGVGRCVCLAFRLTDGLLGLDLPGAVLDRPEYTGITDHIMNSAVEQIFAEDRDAPPLSHNMARIWAAENIRAGMGIFMKTVFPPREKMAAMYPASPRSARIYLYYPVRLKDLALRYGRAAWLLIRRDNKTASYAEFEARGNALADWMAYRR